MRRHARKNIRLGMSLLEVVLALAILAMSAAILASIARTATDNGLIAHRLATAQILAESKMAEVVTGAIPLQGAVGWTPITDTVPSGVWYYQLQTEAASRKDMVGVRLSVSDQAGVDENKEVFYIVRWMIDPSLGLDTMPTQSDASGNSTSSASGSGSGSGGSAGAGAPSGGIQ
ncbi:MAG: prepilin-type N-terminal cleavage/methylation domain-containing protein [Pirellula sp.]|jgi:type II secretion system protein I